jgi:hypothetical protein
VAASLNINYKLVIKDKKKKREKKKEYSIRKQFSEAQPSNTETI